MKNDNGYGLKSDLTHRSGEMYFDSYDMLQSGQGDSGYDIHKRKHVHLNGLTRNENPKCRD